MQKNPFLIFILVITLAVVGAISLIQSRRFADFAKVSLSAFLPHNLGVKGDFSHFEVQFFPPGIAISNPTLEVIGENPAGLPEGTEVKAQRLELTFRALQVLSGKIRIHEVKVVDGSLKTSLVERKEKDPKQKSPLRVSWQDLFQVRAEKITLVNTTVDLTVPSQKIIALFLAKEVSLFQTKRDRVDTYQLELDVSDFKLSHAYDLPFPNEADAIRLSAQLDSSGVYLRQFRLEKKESYVDLSGKLLGDVLKGIGLKFDAELKMKGDLQTVFNSASKKNQPTGIFQFDGKVATDDVEHWRKTFFAQGKMKGEHLKWLTMEAEVLDVEGSFNARTEELKVIRARAQTNPRAKMGPLQLGSGGEVKVGAFETRLGSDEPIHVSLQVEKAHLNWLFSPIISSLFALDGNATGKAEVIVTLPTKDTSLEVEGDIDWQLDYLQLDNQKYNTRRPLSKIFVIPNLKIKGKVLVSEEEVQLEQMQAEIVETKFIVDGAIQIGAEPSFDLRGGGPIDLSEMKELIGLPVKGKGQLSIHVHGPGENVVMDFDSDVHDFEFIHLKFGDFRGRISYLDSASRLRLQKLDCNKGSTQYSVDGFFEFSQKNKMELDANVPSGDLREFLSIFSNLTKDYWWFPESLGGSFLGNIKIRGGIGLAEMDIRAGLTGESWEFYSERLQKANLDFIYEKGKYSISNFYGLKRKGQIHGNLDFSEKDGINWKVTTNDFLLTDFDHLSRLKIPMRGNWNFTSTGKGKFPMIQSLTEVAMSETTFRGRDFPKSNFKMQTNDGKAFITSNLFGNQAKLNAVYDFQEGNPSQIQLEANQLDFAPAILIINPALIRDEQLEGRVSGNYALNFLTGQSELGSGKAELKDYRLQKTNTKFKSLEPVAVKIDKGNFDLLSVNLVGDEGKLNLSLHAQQGNLNGRLRGNIDLGIIEFLTSAVESSEGLMDVDLRFLGSFKAPQVSGDGSITSGMIRLPDIESPIESIRGDWSFKNGLFNLNSLNGDFASGKIAADGKVEFFSSKLPKLDLGINLFENRVKAYPFQYAKTQGNLKIQGDSMPYQITGKLLVDQALSREKIANTRAPGFRASRYSPEEGTSSSLDRPLFELGIDVTAPGKIFVQNELMDLEAKGDVKIVNTLSLPRIVGKAQAIQGKILFKDRSFQIQSGWMEFDSPTVLNPRFEMIANAEVANRKIQMYASGRLDKYRLEFTANPPMKENEILSLLALGVTGEDVRTVGGSVDRSAYQQGEAASLVLHSLDFNREVKNKTGFQIGVDQAVDTTIGQSIFRPRVTEGEPTATPKVVIRRDFGKRFGVLAGSTVGVGTNIQREVNAEMRVTPGFSVLGVWDTYEGASSDESRRSSYGFDLKLQKRFK